MRWRSCSAITFFGIGSDLEANLLPGRVDPRNFVKKNDMCSLYLQRVSSEEISEMISDLKDIKQNLNHISVKIFKENREILAPTIRDIVNASFSAGVFPDVLKWATVIPILKGGDSTLLLNYRPISLLSIFSKIFERCLYNRLIEFTSINKILTPNQHGFLKNHSTETALISYLEHLYNIINLGKYSINLFIDFKKAFDTLNHNILLQKLELYGIRGPVFNLIKSYLSNRGMRVKIGDSFSSYRFVNIGIPQGSILGPLLFILYVNDMPGFTDEIFTVMYADDSNFCASNKSAHDLFGGINGKIELLYNWATCNRLSINSEKSFYMSISNRNLPVNLPAVILNNTNLESKLTGRYLGVTMDRGLKFDQHVRDVCDKVSKNIGVIYRIRKLLNFETLKTLYYALIYPYLLYCNLAWGNIYHVHLKPLEILQKRVIRIINGAEYNSPTNTYFFQNEILKLKDIYKYRLGLYMFNLDRDSLSRQHAYSTRNRRDLLPSFNRTNVSQRSLFYTGPNLWNSIPENIKDSNSLAIFKVKLKKYLISQYSADM